MVLQVGYIMEFESFGNVEPSISIEAIRKLEQVSIRPASYLGQHLHSSRQKWSRI